MLKNAPFYAGFAVDDIAAAKVFYGQTLGVFEVDDPGNGLLWLRAANGYRVLVYPKPGHAPASHTVLNFPVDDIEATVDALTGRGRGVRALRRRADEDRRARHRPPRAEAGLVQGSGRQHPVDHRGLSLPAGRAERRQAR